MAGLKAAQQAERPLTARLQSAEAKMLLKQSALAAIKLEEERCAAKLAEAQQEHQAAVEAAEEAAQAYRLLQEELRGQ